jgi:hypothetical protein
MVLHVAANNFFCSPNNRGEAVTIQLRRGTPVFIEWDDSASYGGWRGDTRGMTTGHVKSIGFVFGVKDEGIILTTSLAHTPEPDLIAALDTLIIPHGCIRNVQTLDLKPVPMPVQIEGTIAKEEEPENVETLSELDSG